MGDKNIIVEMGILTMTDENGKTFEIGEISDIDLSVQNDVDFRVIKNANEVSVECTLKVPFKTRVRLAWEVFKAKRKAKKIIKALTNGNQPLELTINMRRAENEH